MKRALIEAILRNTLPHVDPQVKLDSMGRADAGETLAFARQLEYIFQQAYEVEYPEFAGRRIVPVNNAIPTGARAHTYRMIDDVGQADIINSYADDLPNVDGKGAEYTEKIIGVGDSFFVSIQDLRAAAMMGINIDAQKARTARRQVEQKLDKLIATGDTRVAMTGFANNANVVSSALSGLTGSWASATAAQIQADLEKISKTVFDATLGVHGNPDNGSGVTLVLPIVLYSRIATLRIDTFNMMTVLEYAKTKIPFIKDVTSWGRLDTAGASSVPRIVVLHKDPEVIETMIPQEFEMLPMQPKNLGYSVNCHARWGGVVVRRPAAMRYIDGC